MTDTPGTTSRILWHFTGGPAWNDRTERQDDQPKPCPKAYRALCGILETSELRLGSYHEVVKVAVQGLSHYRDEQGRERSRRKRFLMPLRSAPVCCLADIPIKHLGYHAERYGKFAIGFHRNAVIKNGFNPVFYARHHSRVLRTIHEGFAQIECLDLNYLRMITQDHAPYPGRLLIEAEADTLERSVDSAREGIRYFLAFVKTFAPDEFATIYSEREWRAIKPYRFSHADVAMIVLPRVVKRRHYFDRFMETVLPTLNLPRSVPVVSWEDLVES